MFKSGRWRSQNSKTKAIFKLEFQATQVPQLKGKGLMISLVPADVGKPTVRLEKAAVVEGTCSWENPIYETVKLIKHHKTGRFKEKIYHFIVATGSSKSSYLGEASVDFTDFAEATKPLQISLLLTTSFSGAILHVTIQRMQEADDLREVEENESPTAELLRLQNQVCDCNENESILDFTDDDDFNELNSQNIEQKKTPNDLPTEKHMHQRSSTDWSLGSASDKSMADSSNSPKDNHPRDGLPEASNNSIEMLKTEIRRLERQAEISELELQSLRKQIVKESKRGQDLSKQIVGLREEKDALKIECEQLKSSHKCTDETIPNWSEPESEELRVLLQEIRRELKHEKNLNNTLRLQLQKTEDSNSELILAVNDLDETLEQKNAEISRLSDKAKASQNSKNVMAEASLCKRDQEEEEQALKNGKEVELLKQKVGDLYAEIELHKKDKEELKIQMERLSLDYEFLEQENVDISSKLEQTQVEQMNMQNEYSKSLATIKEYDLQVERLDEKIKKQALEFSQSLDSINELETQVKSLEIELEKKGHDLEDDLEALTKAKVEQDQRAIRAEENLRKTRLINATTAEQLQGQFRRLSLEMTSKFDENEKQAMQAVAEAQDLRLQVRALQDMLKKSNEELALTKDQYEEKLQKLSNETNLQAKHMSLELDEKHAQLETLRKQEEGNKKAFLIKIQTLEAETERLKMDKFGSLEENEQREKLREEIEQLKASISESAMLQEWTKEKGELERKFASLRKETDKIQEESITWKNLKDEKEIIVETLESEMRSLRAEYNDLKHSFFGLKLENDSMMKHGSILEDNLRKKKETITNIQENFKSNSEHDSYSDISSKTLQEDKPALLSYSAKQADILPKRLNLLEESTMAHEVSINASKDDERRNTVEDIVSTEMSTSKSLLKESRFVMLPVESNEGCCSEKEMTVSNCHYSDDRNLTKLLSEVASLNERNKHMEFELKEMQEKYSEISLKFAEVEGERQQLVMTVRNLRNGKKK